MEFSTDNNYMKIIQISYYTTDSIQTRLSLIWYLTTKLHFNTCILQRRLHTVVYSC